MKTVLDQKQIKATITDIASQIIAIIPHDAVLGVIGIRSRGEILARRLADELTEKMKEKIDYGTLDITMYRDDLNEPQGIDQPMVRTTEIGFDINGRTIILVDDVLYTGRSARAAMDALIDLGRPRAIRLAVLVERPGREVPIQPDYAGCRIKADENETVQVNLVESDGKDEVVVE